MKLNIPRTKILLFNRSKKWDFHPEVVIDDKILDIVESTKLLGVMITTDLKWETNTQYMINKARKKLWMIRRIQEVGGSLDDLIMVYTVQIRCGLELACPLWNGSLTKTQVKRLEKIQKTALRIILNNEYKSYTNALSRFKLQSLADRREQLCLKFAKKAVKHSKFNVWFKRSRKRPGHKPKFYLPKLRTKAYETSPIIYLTKPLNSNFV